MMFTPASPTSTTNNNNNNDQNVSSQDEQQQQQESLLLPQQQHHPPSSLIIIGAGMAGIKLAHTCLEANPKMKIVIFEANNYIGGRVKSFVFENHTVEMGANWISGLETKYDNPIWKLAKQVKLNGHYIDERTNDETVCVKDTQGRDVSREYQECAKRFDSIYERAIQEAANRNISDNPQNDVDVRTFLEELGWPPKCDLTDIEKLVEHNILEVWISDNLSQLSVAHNFEEGANDVDLGKDEFFVEDHRGFNCIFDQMVQYIQSCEQAKIHLNHRVQTIDYTTFGNVKVTAQNLTTNETVQFNDYDAIVCTVSLGVLHNSIQNNNNKNKNEGIEFIPPLPQWKQEALQEMQMFTFAKVYAKWNIPFWKTSGMKDDQLMICSNQKKGHYPYWLKYRNTADDDNSHMYMCYLGGTEAERVENLTHEEIKDEIEVLFQQAYSETTTTTTTAATHKTDNYSDTNDSSSNTSSVFRPTAVAVTGWSKDPSFYGSYSLYPVHAFSKIPQDNLRRGIPSTTQMTTQEEEEKYCNKINPIISLYFAGEGFDDKYNGWVQGAYRSGERVANEILGII